mgnify:CR=1 FL=1
MTGRAMTGMAMLASMASMIGPVVMLTEQRATMSEAVAANLIGRFSMCWPASAS